MRCKNSFVAFYAFVLHDNVAYYVPNAVTTESRSAIGLVLQCLRPMKHVASDSFMHWARQAPDFVSQLGNKIDVKQLETT